MGTLTIEDNYAQYKDKFIIGAAGYLRNPVWTNRHMFIKTIQNIEVEIEIDYGRYHLGTSELEGYGMVSNMVGMHSKLQSYGFNSEIGKDVSEILIECAIEICRIEKLMICNVYCTYPRLEMTVQDLLTKYNPRVEGNSLNEDVLNKLLY